MRHFHIKRAPRRTDLRGTDKGNLYFSNYLSKEENQTLTQWLSSLHPLWEFRYSTKRELPSGEGQRRLLRPVYWLGNWQFACLNYYHPPKGIQNRCVRAEPFPPFLQEIIDRVEELSWKKLPKEHIPKGWKLNTCLVNYYGRNREGDRWVDTARVGEHRDYEPGPVASISVGERAMFQFVESYSRQHENRVASQMWLEDGSLQVFSGPYWKDKLFHRVQRVERKGNFQFKVNVPDFEVRRINLTFRYVPEEHFVEYRDLPGELRNDVEGYVRELAGHSEYFQKLVTIPI